MLHIDGIGEHLQWCQMKKCYYLVAFLRNALPSGPGLESMLDENARILRVCEDLTGKHYLPKYTEE